MGIDLITVFTIYAVVKRIVKLTHAIVEPKENMLLMTKALAVGLVVL